MSHNDVGLPSATVEATTDTEAPPRSTDHPSKAYTTGSLARSIQAELVGSAEIEISGLAAIDDAVPGQLTFIRSSKYAARWPASQASAAVVTRGLKIADHDNASKALLVVDNADVAMLDLLRLFASSDGPPPAGVHPTALVDPTAIIGAGVHVGPFCVVGPRTRLADGVVLFGQVYLGADVSIGVKTRLHPGVRVLDRCVLGARCEVWPNVVIGADGFGYLPAPDRSGMVKIPHIGNVVIEDDVDIGANSSIDRGKFGSTFVGRGTKIDNHCQIAHNCTVGRSVVICGMTGIAGSVTIGDGAVIAGHVGLADNITIGSGAIVAAKAGVIGDVPPGETWFGTPAGPHREQMRSAAAFRKLPDFLKRVERLEKTVENGGPAA